MLDTVNNMFSDDLKQRLLQKDLEKLTESFKLLNETISDVSTEAAFAAEYLKNEIEHTSKIFLSTIDMIDDFILIEDGVGRWKVLNQFGLNLHGLTYDQVIGKTCTELANEFPDYTESFNYCHKIDELTWESKKAHREIMTFPFNGKLLHFDVIKTPIFNEDGSRKEIITIGRDITDYIGMQERRNACSKALNQASDNILIVDHNKIISFANDISVRTFGFNKHEEIEGLSILELILHERYKETVDSLWMTVNSNFPWNGVIKFMHTSGHAFSAHTSVIPIMNGHITPIYFIFVIKMCLELEISP